MNTVFLALYATFSPWPHIASNVARHIRCGRSARPVRREGWRSSRHPYPYPIPTSADVLGERTQTRGAEDPPWLSESGRQMLVLLRKSATASGVKSGLRSVLGTLRFALMA